MEKLTSGLILPLEQSLNDADVSALRTDDAATGNGKENSLRRESGAAVKPVISTFAAAGNFVRRKDSFAGFEKQGFIATRRLVLRNVEQNDFNDIHEYSSDAENTAFMLFEPFTEEDTAAHIRKCLEVNNADVRTAYELSVFLPSENKVIGGARIALHAIKQQMTDRTVAVEGEIGWILNKKYWRFGFGKEIASAILAFGFEHLRCHRIVAYCTRQNVASYKVMEKSGMTLVSAERKCAFGRIGDKYQWLDMRKYAMLAEDYFPRG